MKKKKYQGGGHINVPDDPVYGDITLPEFTVVSTNPKNSRKVKTLRNMRMVEKQLEKEGKGNNLYPVWTKANRPDLDIVSPESIPLANKMLMKIGHGGLGSNFYDPTKNKISLMRNYKNIDYEKIKNGLEKYDKSGTIKNASVADIRKAFEEDRDYNISVEDIMDDTSSISTEPTLMQYITEAALAAPENIYDNTSSTGFNADAFIQELSHGYQRRTGRLPLTRAVKDYTRSLTSKQNSDSTTYQQTYETPGTLEHEAHKIIAPKLQQTVNQPKRYTISLENYKYGGHTKQKLNTGGYYEPVGMPVDPVLTKKRKENMSFQDVLGLAAPLANLIPGVGTAVSAGLGAAASFKDGGHMKDVPLSDNSFQVKGNPNVTDGNRYGNVMLDHNEVVKDDFVFSDSIYNPLTGNKFSKDAKKLEKPIGDAQKKVDYYNDQISKDGMEIMHTQTDELAKLQEGVAQAMGLRRRPQDGLREAPGMKWGGKYQGGGFLPEEGQTYMEIPGWSGKYYDPYNQRFVSRDFRSGQYTPWDTTPRSDKAYNPSTKMMEGNTLRYPYVEGDFVVDPISGKRLSISDHMAPSMTGPEATVTAPRVPLDIVMPDRTPSRAPMPQTSPRTATPPTIPPMPLSDDTPPSEQEIQSQLGPSQARSTSPRDLISDEEYFNKVMQHPSQDIVGRAYNPKSTPQNELVDQRGNTPLSDILQIIATGSKFFGNKPETQRLYQDTTRITQERYDPRTALSQNQRSFQNRVNAIDTPSVNLRRSLANQLYATRLNSDNQVRTQYDQMNQRARTQYESRLSNQSQYNIRQRMLTDDINARNRGQSRSNLDVAFNTLGNFGKSLGQRESANQVLDIYRELYPDVYKRIESALR